jgi:hypothetical protein
MYDRQINLPGAVIEREKLAGSHPVRAYVIGLPYLNFKLHISRKLFRRDFYHAPLRVG